MPSAPSSAPVSAIPILAACLPALASLAAQDQAPRPVVAVGDAAPGAVAGAFFKYIQEPTPQGTTVAFRGGLAVLGDRLSKTRAVKEGGRGLWLANASGLQLFALEDQPAPGLEHGLFDNFPTLALGPGGHLAFVAGLKPTQVASQRRSGKKRDDPDHAIPPGARQALYLVAPGQSPRLLLRTGDAVADLPGHEWRSFDYTAAVPSLGASGRLALRATTSVAAAQDHVGFWLIDGGKATLLAGLGTPWKQFGSHVTHHAPQVASDGAVLFFSETAERQPVVVQVREAATTLGAGELQRIQLLAPTDAGAAICLAETRVGGQRQTAILRVDDRGVERLVEVGMPIVGSGAEARLTGITPTWDVAGDGTIVFLGQTTAGQAVLLARGGRLTAIAMLGATAPGTEQSVVFESFSPPTLTCNRKGQALFFATTRQASLRGDPSLAKKMLFAWDGSACRLVARVGGTLDVGGGRAREVMALDLIGGRALADDGTAHAFVTWRRAKDDPKEADIGAVDGRCAGVYALSLGKANESAPRSAAPTGTAISDAVVTKPAPKGGQPAPAEAAAPARGAPPPPADAAKITLPAHCWRNGEPDADALLAASKEAQAARDRVDRRSAPLSYHRYEVRRVVLGDVSGRVQWWTTQQKHIEQRQARLQQLAPLGESRETARLTKEIDAMQKELATSKATWRDAPVAAKSVSGLAGAFFVVAANQPARPVRHRNPSSPLANGMDNVLESLAVMFANGASAEERALIQQLNDCCGRIARHAAADELAAAQRLCDAVAAWFLDDAAQLPER